MLTIGLVNELRHIASQLNTTIDLTLKLQDVYTANPLRIHIQDNILDLYYQENHIWREDIGSDQSMFGLESCQTIAEIIRMIDIKWGNWQALRYIEE